MRRAAAPLLLAARARGGRPWARARAPAGLADLAGLQWRRNAALQRARPAWGAEGLAAARPFSSGAAPPGPGKKTPPRESEDKDRKSGDDKDPQTLAQRMQGGAQSMASNVKDGAQSMASNAMDTASDMRDNAQAAMDQVPVSRIKALLRDFGPVAIGVYGGIYVGTLGLLYGLVETDIVGAGDAISILKKTGLNNFVDMDKINPRMGNFAAAWILTKFTEPARLVLALAVTPRVARAIGWAPRKRDKDGNAIH